MRNEYDGAVANSLSTSVDSEIRPSRVRNDHRWLCMQLVPGTLVVRRWIHNQTPPVIKGAEKADESGMTYRLTPQIPLWLFKGYSFNMEIMLMYLSSLERHFPNLLINDM